MSRTRVLDDCRHYVMQTVRSARQHGAGRERIERCTLGANEPLPFSCPEGCLFYEPRSTSSAGWTQGPSRS